MEALFLNSSTYVLFIWAVRHSIGMRCITFCVRLLFTGKGGNAEGAPPLTIQNRAVAHAVIPVLIRGSFRASVAE